ncbi:ZN438 protein, partial [Alcedo cyanopectus]|nr:ZN438 protein [Ceyx cyanopectus]
TFAGGVFLHADPAEKHCVQQSLLGQQNQETCSGKTISTDKHKSPSDIIRSFQKKSQFRTIAPKMVPKILTSGMVSCLQSSLPEQSTPISAAGSKPLVVPTQNYTVMQVAGHEGTFSLVALPYVAPALMQQVQQPNVAPSKNLKLPIPRYQSVRNKLRGDKKPAQISALGAPSKIPPEASQTSPVTSSAEDCPEAPSASEPAEQAMPTDSDSAEITVATSGNKRSCVESGSPGASNAEIAKGNVSAPPVAKDSLSKPVSDALKLSLQSVKAASGTTREECSTSEKPKEKATGSPGAVAIPSPAVFRSALQAAPPAPKGKLPILPYSRMRNSVLCKSKQNSVTMGVSSSSPRSECEKIAALVKTLHAPPKASEKRVAVSFPQAPKPTFSTSSKVDVDSLKKLNSAATKRRGRKRRAPDDLLAFQTRRRRCIVTKFREGRERLKADLQPPEDKKAEAVKKYRSIRPKPVVVLQALAPLAPAALAGAPPPEGLHQDVLLNGSLPNKHLHAKRGDSTAAKPTVPGGEARPSAPKPSYKCPVCSHIFQFQHHLRDHMNTHTNRRPYSCRLCRKAYLHSGSLSTHMKLHHGEGKPKKLVCCEFCAKVFGHARVYFGHLREVHRVVISTEPSSGEQQLQDASKKRDTNRKEQEAAERGNKCNFEDLFHNPGEVKLQVRCGRCQFIAQSFGEMKFHLLCSHGEEIQGRVKEGVLQGNRGAKGELLKHSTHFWKQRSDRRHLAKCSSHGEEFYPFPKLKRQIYIHHPNNIDASSKSELTQPGGGEAAKEIQRVGFDTASKAIEVWSKSGYNCILCKQLFGRKEELCNHWQSHHNCEEPSTLWAIFSLLSKQGVIELSNSGEC